MPDSKPTQQFVPVKEVRDGVVLLKNGGYRGILMCSSINFALKSEDEQRAIIGGFQSFLNTLDFSVQMVVHSRRMDIRPYLKLLEERRDTKAAELMLIQHREQSQSVKNFIEGSEVMTKLFYVVVPYDPPAVGKVTGSIPFLKGKETKTETSSFETDKAQLMQRIALVAGSLSSTGLRAVPLGTEEVIELLYRSFNLGELETPIRLEA